VSDSEIMEDTQIAEMSDVTNDSHTVKYIEIVPLDHISDDYCGPEGEDNAVKGEDLLIMKAEPADECNEELRVSILMLLHNFVKSDNMFVVFSRRIADISVH